MADVGTSGPDEILTALDVELESVGLEAELCVVGGAVIVLAFDAEPGTRRVGALFKSTSEVRAAAVRVTAEYALPSGWLNGAVRTLVRSSTSVLGDFFEGSHLRVFEAPAEYVLAMKSASLDREPPGEAEADLAYILRSIDVNQFSDAKSRISRYFTERQLPDSLDTTLQRLLSGA